jgi:hypothetical protein
VALPARQRRVGDVESSRQAVTYERDQTWLDLVLQATVMVEMLAQNGFGVNEGNSIGIAASNRVRGPLERRLGATSVEDAKGQGGCCGRHAPARQSPPAANPKNGNLACGIAANVSSCSPDL